MGGRYIITGAQIGTIKALLKERQTHKVVRVLNEIFEDNFIGDSNVLLSEDVSLLSNYLSNVRD